MSAGAGKPPEDDVAKTSIYDSARGATARGKPETQRGYDRHRDSEPAEPRATPATPTAPAATAPGAQPMRAISRKSQPGIESDKFARPLPEVKLRSMEEVRSDRTPVRALGNLAPPRDPRQARSRRVNDYVIWGLAAAVVASIVMLLVWFLAR